ncbi:MAG: cache domain-containing protein, partial [Treponema sp.]|nr:cache domain-containing protein [Treponema sp.]
MAKRELDRFDTKAKRNISLQAKLIALVGGFILLGCSTVAIVSLTVFDSKLVKNTQDELEYTEHGAKHIMDDWLATLALSASLLSDSPVIVQAATRENISGAEAYLKSKATEQEMDVIAITDTKGTVLCSNGYQVSTSLASIPCVAAALKGQASKGFGQVGNLEFVALAASPVYAGGKVTGCVLSGYDLTNGYFTDLMQEGYNVECTVFKDIVRMSSTIPNAVGTKLDNQTIISKVLQKGETFEGTNIILGKKYYSTYQPLQNDDGSVVGMLFIAKGVEVVQAVKQATLAIVTPIIIVLVIVLLILSYMFIHWLMWRIYNVTNFLKELETGDADLTKRCKLFIRDEIGDLVIHFDLFLDKLQQIMRDIQGSKSQLTESGNDMSRSAEDTASAITEIMANIGGITSQIRNQGGSVKQTAGAVDDISYNIQNMENLVEGQTTSVAQASAAVEQMIGNISSV